MWSGADPRLHKGVPLPPACFHAPCAGSAPHHEPPPARLQVLDEIGIDLSAQIGAAPKQRLPAQRQAAAAPPEEEDELAMRLAALK